MPDTKNAAPQETSHAERFTYSAYFAGQNVVYMLIQGYLLMYYVSHLKLDPALVATIFLLVRIWDAVNDPIIGLFMDRVRFRNSRYRGWITLSTFTMPLSTFILFLAPAGAGTGVRIAYAVATYLAWDILYTFSEVPSFAISTSMTTSERERTLLLALTQIGSVSGAAIGMLVITLLLGDGVDRINWLLLGGLPALLSMIFMIPQMFHLEERHYTEVVENVTLLAMLREVLRNDQHFLMMGLYVSQAFLNAASVFAAYVAERYYGNAQYASITSIFALLGIVVMGTLTPKIVRRIGKTRYLEVSMLLTIVLSIPAFFISGDMAILALVFLGLRTIALVITSLLRPMFTADCIEYGEYKTGVRSDSTAFAIQTLFNKTGDAIGTSLGGYVLALTMFDESLPLADQSVSTIDTLQKWYVLLPMVMAAIMYLGPKLFYKLDEATVVQMIEANARGERS